jgi:ribosomal protein S12 methylthiotransferase accessory factor
VRWAPAIELGSGADALVPAQLVYRYRELAPGETPIAYSTTNGVACGPTPEEAVLGGLLEVVERDAVMIAWLARLSLPRVDRRADAWLVDLERERFDPAGGGHELIDLSAFSGVPVALATVGGADPGDVRFALGSAAAATMREACWKALREAYQARTTLRALLADVARPGFARGRSEVTSVAYEHGIRFARSPQSERAAFLTASASTLPIGDCPSIEETDVGVRLREVAARLASRGVDTYAVDLTPPDVRAGGFTVVRVLSPQAVAPGISPAERFLGGERLYEAPRLAGLAEGRLEPVDLNPDPHPYV